MGEKHAVKYADALRELAGAEGRRNGMLLGVASLGLIAGRSPAEVEGDLLEAGAAGRSPLTVAEVRRAVQRAERDGYGGGAPRNGGCLFAPRRPPVRNHVGAEGRGAAFVADMTRRGVARLARWAMETGTLPVDADPMAALAAASPRPLDGDTLPGTMAALQVAALFSGDGEHVYAGPLDGARDSANVYRAGDLVRGVCYGGRFSNPVRLPDRVLPNPITGRAGPNKAGGITYRGESTVTAFRNAVVEFDGMDADGDGCRRQALFWLGVVTSHDEQGRMPLPVRCLVFSGSKSIHAALRLAAYDRGEWDEDWARLADALPGLDAAFRSPAQCMRLAGAVRTDGKGAGAEQTLLWCAQPSPDWCATIRAALAGQVSR